MEHKMPPWRVAPLRERERERERCLPSLPARVSSHMGAAKHSSQENRIISTQNASILLPSLKYLTLYFRN